MKTKRQTIRRALLIGFFILFPVTMFYFSPYTVIIAAAEGIIGCSLVMYFALFVASLFIGRANCGYFCPLAGLQECLFSINNKKIPVGKLNYIKYVVWFLWLCTIIALFVNAGGVKGFNFLFTNDTTFSHYPDSVNTIMIYFGVVLGIALFVLLFGKRTYCHYLCWLAPFMIVGRFFGKHLKIPALHLKSDKNKCINCGQCDEICPMCLEVSSQVNKNCLNHTECILCGECVDVCPKKAVRFGFGFVNKSIGR